ncbi:MAG: hypothetical protein Q9163_004144 [Psora crenata]
MSAMTMPASTRQPFGPVSHARLRNLGNIKNTLNALPNNTATTLKRHAPTDFDDVDYENIDPKLFLSPSKKAKGIDSIPTGVEKTPYFTLVPSGPSAKNVNLPQVVGRKRKAEESPATADIQPKRRVRFSPPPAAPAVRSPKHKRVGIHSRRRAPGTSGTRINPPAPASSMPFSLSAALAGTVPMKSKPKSSTKGWHFDIHEDTPEDEMANLMEHSTCTLDISDDESRLSPKGDRDNKENIPPVECQNNANIPLTRREMLNDGIRSPLGDLNAEDFYADGCDANSIIVVPAEDPEPTDEKAALEGLSSPSPPSTEPVTDGQQSWEGLVGQLSANHKADAIQSLLEEAEPSSEEPSDVQIWESESAKAEDEANNQDKAAIFIMGQEILP